MLFAQIIAQEGGFNLPSGGEAFFWLIGAAVIVGLYVIITRTRKRSYNEYFERQRRAEEQRLNDPDMAKPDEVE